jgi:AcrR family transcriptional regulator
MPRYVDHDQRRHEVAEIARQIVVAEGRKALTVRRVAESAGYSTTVVSHYFSDVGELLHATYEAAAARTRARFTAVVEADPLDVRGLMEAVLPLDAERLADWRVYYAFWSEAIFDPDFSELQRGRARDTTKRLDTMLRGLAAEGRLGADIDVAHAAGRLGALIPGIAGLTVFDPTGWGAARQRAVLDDELRLLGIAPRRG